MAIVGYLARLLHSVTGVGMYFSGYCIAAEHDLKDEWYGTCRLAKALRNRSCSVNQQADPKKEMHRTND